MVVNDFTDALMAKIAESVKDMRLPVKNGEPRPPKVIDGYLPPKRSGADDDFPLVIVRPEKGEIEERAANISAVLIVGCWSEEFDGYKHCVNVMERIKSALATMENGTLADKYVLQYPIKWTLAEEQPYPLWQLEMELSFAHRAPQSLTDWEE